MGLYQRSQTKTFSDDGRVSNKCVLRSSNEGKGAGISIASSIGRLLPADDGTNCT